MNHLQDPLGFHFMDVLERLYSMDGRWSDMGTPSQNSVIFEKYFFGQKKY
jgi:hypothetical protein